MRIERGEVELQRVPEDEVDVVASAELLAQPGLERPVDLDRVDVRDAVGEETRQDAEARADLEHDVVGSECGEPFDHAEDVLVDEEVLAVRLFRDGRSRKPEDGRGVGVDLRGECIRLLAARLREGRDRVHDVGRLVGAAAARQGREVRAVGLGRGSGRPAPGSPRRAAPARSGTSRSPRTRRSSRVPAPARGGAVRRSSEERRRRRSPRARRASPRPPRGCGSRSASRARPRAPAAARTASRWRSCGA